MFSIWTIHYVSKGNVWASAKLALPKTTEMLIALGLTTEGARFYRDGVQMLKKFDDTINKFRADTALHGQLKVGMGPALSRPIMLRAVWSFQTLHPEFVLFSSA
jgi:hypothetical protein